MITRLALFFLLPEGEDNCLPDPGRANEVPGRDGRGGLGTVFQMSASVRQNTTSKSSATATVGVEDV